MISGTMARHSTSPSFAFIAFVSLFLVTSHIFLLASAASFCEQSQKSADECAKDILFLGTKPNSAPVSVDQMDSFCTRQDEDVTCLLGHQICLKGFAREMLKLATKYMQEMIRKICGTKEERSIFIHHYKCFQNDPNRRKPVLECVDRFVFMLKQIRDRFSHEDQFAGMCCTFDMFSKCVHGATKKVCDDVTGPDTAKYMEFLVLRSLNYFVDLSCGNFATISLCEQHSPNISQIIEWTFVSKNIPSQKESIVFPIIDIVSGHSAEEDDLLNSKANATLSKLMSATSELRG